MQFIEVNQKAALAEVMRETCEAISTILEEEQKEGSSLVKKGKFYY